MNVDVDVERFEFAQQFGGIEHGVPYDVALRELRAGRKQSHWIWYVFPQALEGDSLNSRTYRIRNLAEAEAYVANDLLWGRYVECVIAVEQALWKAMSDEGSERGLEAVFGSHIDARKFRSSLTLFFKVTQRDTSERTAVFREMVDYVGRNMPIIWGKTLSCGPTLMLFQKWQEQASS